MFDTLSVDQLNRILTASKWIFGILAVLMAFVGVFNQLVSDRIATLQVEQKVHAQKNLEVSEAELKQTKERTAQLEAKLAPRVLSQEQQTAISNSLVKFAGTQFEFASYQDDAEVKGLVMSLIKTLKAARWKGLNAREFLMAGLVEGVVIEYAPASEAALGSAASALAQLLNAKGIVARSNANSELVEFPDRIRIKVGKKPS